MKKTSVYLTDQDRRRLRELARRTGRSQAEIVREAIATYDPLPPRDRYFALMGSFDGPGDSIADYDEDELVREAVVRRHAAADDR